MADSDLTFIRTTEKPFCYLCGATGVLLYTNLQDRLFGAPGLWNLKQCPNPDCGLIWLDPMPMPEDIGKAYLNYFTHYTKNKRLYQNIKIFLKKLYLYFQDAYLAEKFSYPCTRSFQQKALSNFCSNIAWLRKRFAESIAWLPFKKDGRILDVGCGNGAFIAHMQRLGWLVEGLDLDPEAVAYAKSRGLEVRCGTLEEQEYPDQTFDAITLFHVIEHVYRPINLLVECWRLLKKGGCLVLTTPNSKSYGHQLFKDKWRGLEPPRHLYLFNPDLLKHMAKRSGFLSYSTITKTSAFYYIESNRISGKCKNKISSLNTHLKAILFKWRIQNILFSNPELGETVILRAFK